MFKAQSNIYDGGFFANIGKPLTIFTKQINHKCLAEAGICLSILRHDGDFRNKYTIAANVPII